MGGWKVFLWKDSILNHTKVPHGQLRYNNLVGLLVIISWENAHWVLVGCYNNAKLNKRYCYDV